MDLSAAEITEACGGRLLSGDPERRFREVAIDSRRVPRDSLFAAIPGARVDGHTFLSKALESGAAGALVMREVAAPPGAVIIRIEDTTEALQALGALWRDRLRATVIGVAGSNGKTTTKETLGAVFGRAGRTWATPGNANSQVGAPLALLDTPLDADFAILELGTSAPGELGRLARMARPHHAVVTAAFAEHLEWLGSVAGVIKAETEILDVLDADALALVGSAEPALVAAARTRAGLRVESVGSRDDDAWRISEIRTTRAGTDFRLRSPSGDEHAWRLPLLGAPAAWAGAFATALATELGISPAQIQAGLDRVRPAAHRLVALQHESKPLLVLDDCYNSNPASCIAAVDTAAALAGDTSRLVLVVGDMLELGEATHAAHEEVGTAIGQRSAHVDVLIAVGPESKRIAEVAARHGVDAVHAADADEATRLVEETLSDGRPSTVLAKASRGIGLDRMVEALIPG